VAQGRESVAGSSEYRIIFQELKKKSDDFIDQLCSYHLICQHSAPQSKSVTDNIQFTDIKLTVQYSPE
jgi:hypothetical protein